MAAHFGRLSKLVLILTALFPSIARADLIVLPNANTATSGNGNTLFPLGLTEATFQWVYSSSQLTSIVGDNITSIGFRLPAGASTVASATTFAQWNLVLSPSVNPPGSLSPFFPFNVGPGSTNVLSGPLTIPANSLVGGAGPNPFYDITFTTPYRYTGGDLLFTLTYLLGSSTTLAVDANTLPNSVTDTVSAGTFGAMEGTHGGSSSPITQLDFTPAVVPEPSSLVLFALGGFTVAGWRWRKARRTA
jgi:hypothetical protein